MRYADICNNPFIPFSPASFEDREFKMQRIENEMHKRKLIKMQKEYALKGINLMHYECNFHLNLIAFIPKN